MKYIIPVIILIVLSIVVQAAPTQIIVGKQAPDLEIYAARELQRYLYALSGTMLSIQTDEQPVATSSFIIGQVTTNKKMAKLVQENNCAISATDPGPEGYVIKKIKYGKHETIVIAGSDAQGVLYGVYGLLDDYYGIGFYMGGDVLPEVKVPLQMVQVNERKAPRQYIRGLLPWTNFPQSATVYSIEDWKFIIDQMAKMRLNFLNIHNYNGMLGHNEMFHNWTYNGFTSRVWNATARKAHSWGMSSWDIKEYRFGAADLFDDYDFGADAALHNDSMSNWDVFRKGVSEFKLVIQYAHARGVKVGLGLELDLIPEGYGTTADDPGLIDARIQQVITDYPDLDYLLLYRSELIGKDLEKWITIFNRVYTKVKKEAPGIRIAVSGWGIEAGSTFNWPPDVICAPIAAYSAGCVSGAEYKGREYWGCPWMERDVKSSQYYYPYNIELSETIAAYQQRAGNMKGWQTLTWRLTDAIDAKLSYIAKAPWDIDNKYSSSHAVYYDYAMKNYGPAAATAITAIIDQNEPYAIDNGECEYTGGFTGTNRGTDIQKADSQLEVIDHWIDHAPGPGSKARLQLLRHRIEAVKSFCELDQQFPYISWNQLPGAFERWAKNFTERVTDISSLGNVQSTQNRWIKLRYVAIEDALRSVQEVKSPSHVQVRGTMEGAFITWKNEQPGHDTRGFNLYRNKKKVNDTLLAPAARIYTDLVHGVYQYSITAVNNKGQESLLSVPVSSVNGNADSIAPQVVVISAPGSGIIGQPVNIKCRVLDNRKYELITATLYFRTMGKGKWTILPMLRRTKAVFTGSIPNAAISAAGVEYYIEVSDGRNTGHFPAAAPHTTQTLIGEKKVDLSPPGKPGNISVTGSSLAWTASNGDVFWYKIYRSRDGAFTPGISNYVTYVSKDTHQYTGNRLDFSGQRLSGKYYYKITAVDKTGNESEAVVAGIDHH